MSQSQSLKEEEKDDSPSKVNKVEKLVLNLVFPNSQPLTRITEEPKELTTSDQTSIKTGAVAEMEEFRNKKRSNTQKKLRIMI